MFLYPLSIDTILYNLVKKLVECEGKDWEYWNHENIFVIQQRRHCQCFTRFRSRGKIVIR